MSTLQLATPPPLRLTSVSAAFERVLLAIDFGPASLGAARWATTHVIPRIDAVLAHAMPFTADSVCGDVTPNSENESLRHMTPALVGGLAGFGATLDVAAFRSVVRIGRPSACLAAITDDAGADLMVLGRRADANRNRVGEPNVIERTARRTAASVLVVPEGTTKAPEHILAAVDDSSFARAVVRVARWLARIHELPLTVLHVVPPAAGAYDRVVRSAKHLFPGAGDKRGREMQQAAVAAPAPTRRWLSQLGGMRAGSNREATEIRIGDPAREIVRASMDRGSSLIVVGMRGADEAPLGSLGSVARELIGRGPLPVLAVNAV